MQICTVLFHAGLQGKAGLRPKIMRTADAGCCKWCSGLAGDESYPVKNHDMYRRHPNCRCKVEYDSGRGDRKTIHEHGDAAQRRAQEKEREERIKKYNAMTADEQNKYNAQRTARQRFAEKQSTAEEESATIKIRKQIGLLSSSSRRYEPEINIGKSVGAKAKNYDIIDLATRSHNSFAEGTKIKNVEVFAGKGTKSEYRNAKKYADKYGGSPEDWQHVKGHGIVATMDGDRPAEIHWSQCKKIGKVDLFIKKWED